MKKTTMMVVTAVLGLVLGAFGAGIVSAQMITVTGTINDESQIVVNQRTVYTVGDTEKGEEMLEQVEVDRKVQVTGEVEEEDGEKVIYIISYKILPEENAEQEQQGQQ